jgi:Uma2 family endonuclease
MTLSFAHDNAARWIGRLIAILALDLGIPLRTGGSTTLKASLKKKGLEPDESFWIKNYGLMRGKKQWTADDPPPDLVVEVDVTHSSLDRISIYAALGVPEIWHFDGETFEALVLGKRGKYRRSTASRSFPILPIASFARFVTDLETVDDETELLKEFRQWLRDEVIA